MKFQKGDVVKTRSGQHEFYVEEAQVRQDPVPGLYAKVTMGTSGEQLIHEADIVSVRRPDWSK